MEIMHTQEHNCILTPIYFFDYIMEFFHFQNNPKDLLDLWDCLEDLWDCF